MIEFPKALDLEALRVIYPNLEDYQESLEISSALFQKGNPLLKTTIHFDKIS